MPHLHMLVATAISEDALVWVAIAKINLDGETTKSVGTRLSL